jgi:hypothetical protein
MPELFWLSVLRIAYSKQHLILLHYVHVYYTERMHICKYFPIAWFQTDQKEYSLPKYVAVWKIGTYLTNYSVTLHETTVLIITAVRTSKLTHIQHFILIRVKQGAKNQLGVKFVLQRKKPPSIYLRMGSTECVLD